MRKTTDIQYLVIAVLGVIIITFLYQTALNILSIRKTTKPAEVQAPLAAPGEVAAKAAAGKRLVPVNPADYGFQVHEEYDPPPAEEDWKNLFRENLDRLKTEMPQETEKAISEIKMTQEKYQARLAEVNGRIEFFEAELKEDPHSKETRMRLDKLRILKALGETLEEDIIKD